MDRNSSKERKVKEGGQEKEGGEKGRGGRGKEEEESQQRALGARVSLEFEHSYYV